MRTFLMSVNLYHFKMSSTSISLNRKPRLTNARYSRKIILRTGENAYSQEPLSTKLHQSSSLKHISTSPKTHIKKHLCITDVPRSSLTSIESTPKPSYSSKSSCLPTPRQISPVLHQPVSLRSNFSSSQSKPFKKRPLTPRNLTGFSSQSSPSISRKSTIPKNQAVDSYITQMSSPEDQTKAHENHIIQTITALKIVKSLGPADTLQIAAKVVNLPIRIGYECKKTVIFDLDETLVHCCEDPSKAHVVIPITLPSGEIVDAGMNIRPYARECLMSANEDYEVIVFTASHSCYADKVLDYLDPTGELIHHRLYRDSCILIDGVYVKDLRILLNRRLEDIIIVDNAAYSFGYQLNNGIPIITWMDDMTDRELYKLMDYLKVLSIASDVRIINKKTFNLDRFYEVYKHYLSSDAENVPPSI